MLTPANALWLEPSLASTELITKKEPEKIEFLFLCMNRVDYS